MTSKTSKSNTHRPLTDEEHQLIDAINKLDVERAKSLLSLASVYVDCLDADGMTPLQHACYKNSPALVEELITRGADVNSNEHDMGYTALMFAGLAGNVKVVELLLKAGAKTTLTNSVGRTATQMAAFVGNHKVVSVVNNFLSKDEVEYFTKPDGPKGEIRLPSDAAAPLHALLVSPNLSPIKVCLAVESQPSLLNNLEKVVSVMDTMTQCFFTTERANEVLSIKFHIICVTLRRAWKHKVNNEKSEGLQSFLKILLAGIEPMGIAEGMERLIRTALKEYPYIQCQLLHQMVRDLSRHEVGHLPTALDVITSHLNGHQFFADNSTVYCATCNQLGADKRCSACSAVAYCQKSCQKLHWFTHKKFCSKLKEIRLQAEKETLERNVLEERIEKEEEEKKKQNDVEQKENEIEPQSDKESDKCEVDSLSIKDISMAGDTVVTSNGESEKV